MTRQSWIYDRETGDLVTRDEYAARCSSRREDRRSTIHDAKMAERGSWVYDRESGEIVPKSVYHRPISSGPMVISDYVDGSGVNGLWHPAEGRRTDSKSEFRKWTKAHGCVEVGDQKPEAGSRPKLDQRSRVEEIKRAMGAL